MKSVKRALGNASWLCLGFLMISLLWQALEMAFYGEVQPRKVDDIVGLMWSAFVVLAYKRGVRHGKEATHE